MAHSHNFGAVSTIRRGRSRFHMTPENKLSMSVGKLYPLQCIEVLPGDTFKQNLSFVARSSSSFVTPVLDNMYFDEYTFFVPCRLLYDDWEKVFGNPNPSQYTNPDFEEVPVTTSASTCTLKSVADYLGIPPGAPGAVPPGISLLPFRAFALIYNTWFRNENTVDEVFIQKGAYDSSKEALNGNAWSATNYTGMLPNVGKAKDYFTSCLPQPQKGTGVNVPLGTFAPVVTRNGQYVPLTQHNSLTWANVLPSTPTISFLNSGESFGLQVTGDDNTNYTSTWPEEAGDQSFELTPANLWTDLQAASGANVNDLRLAFALQKMLEEDALGGSRYKEYILMHFGVNNADSRLQMPEFLGGHRTPITIQQVAQTSASESGKTPLGSLSGYSLSGSSHEGRFTKSFTEHGYIITVACIRQFHTYSQGIPRMFQRKKREDFFDPLFGHLGNQPVYTSELYANGQSDVRDDVFGYQEAWVEYRTLPSTVHGEMRPNVTNAFDTYTFADNYASKPVLGQQFTDETSAYVGRTLNGASGIDQFLVDVAFDITAVRVLPMYSTPGLLDH